MTRRRRRKKTLKYNRDHPRPKLGEKADVGDFPRTIEDDVDPLVEFDPPFKIAGSKMYRMGPCTVHHRIVPEGEAIFPGHYLSVSHPHRYPTWDEVAEARYRLIPDEVYMIMPLPPRDEYLNIHPYMFNLHQLGVRRTE